MNTPSGYLNIDNAHLRVEGNIVAENIELGNIQIGPTYGLASVTDVGNTTSQTVQFTNAATGLVTTGNVSVGKELTVSGNVVMTGTGALTLPSGTTAQQPTGVEGMVRFNTTTNRMEFYSGTEWRSLGSVSATGGTVTTFGGYRIHTFTQDGDFVVESGGPVEYLIVAGGGGGGRNVAGGGGGGGYRSSVFGVGSGGGRDQYETPMTVVSGTTYPVVVGQGGAGSDGSDGSYVNGTNGGDSSFNSIVAVGGGGGGRGDHNGNSGGSGGGGGARSPTGDSVGGAGTTEQGFAGGAGKGSAGYYPAGGGGGAGEIGQSYVSSTQAGRGGNGLLSIIDGIPTYRGGGGGGSVLSGQTPGAGGLGGGGAGERQGTGPIAEDGVANTGGGGGGGHGPGGNGGSGIVIIRYKYI